MESAYASTFLTSVEPQHAANILRDRVAANRATANDLAEWFRELQAIETTYCRSLGKLAGRIATMDVANLGVLEKSWRREIDNINALATNHSRFASKLSQDVIGPLLQHDQEGGGGAIGMLERSLSQVAHDMEGAQSKMQKADQAKSKNRSDKHAEAQEELRRARGRWDSEAPNTFERLQQVDESRVAFLRDALVRYETNTIDLYAAQVKLSEAAIASLLEVTPTDEPMDFVTKKLAQGPTPAALRVPVPLTRSTSNGDAGSIRSSNNAGTSLKSKFGTLLKGKSSSGSPGKRRSMMPGGFGRSNKTKDVLPEMQEEPEQRPTQSATPTHTSSTNGDSTPRAAQVYDARPPVIEEQQVTAGRTRSPAPAIAIAPPAADIFTTQQPDRALQSARSPAGVDQAFASTPTTEEPAVGSLQNSLRAVNIRHNSINAGHDAEDAAAMDLVSSTLRAQPTVSRRSRGRRDVRSAVYGASGDESAQDVARDVLGSPVVRSPKASYFEPAVSSEPLYTPSAAALPPSGTTSFFSRGDSIDRQNTGSAFSYDGTESIRSSRSTVAAPLRHLEPTAPGFHLSVVETVSLLLSADGTPSNFSVTGEAAAANLDPTDDVPLHLQIQSPDAIDRLVPNNYLLKTTGQHVYEISPDALPHMTTLFKYQVQPDVGRQARFLPILLDQKWSPEPSQTSVKLTYRLNPLFGASSLTLHDVEVTVSVRGPANSCVAKPSGTFVKRSSKLVWRLNELTLESGREGILLARFKTESMCSPADTIELKFRSASSNIARGSGFGVYATRTRDNPFADSPTVENVMVQTAYVLQSGKFAVSTAL